MRCRACGAENDFTGTNYEQRIVEGQMPLFDPIENPDFEGCLTKADRFWTFHQRNWHVAHAITILAKRARRRGIAKWGIAGVFEVLRWESSLSTQGGEWKLNNDYKPFYARLIMDRSPDLVGFFDLREMKGGE